MFSLKTVFNFIVDYIPYGKEIRASIRGPYFYKDQVYREEDDLELGIQNEEPPQIVSHF